MNEDLRELAADYVLGTMPAPLRVVVAQRLAHDQVLREAVNYWEARLLPLNQLTRPVQPPADLWARISESLGLSPAKNKISADWWHSLPLWRTLAGAGLAAAASLAVLLAREPAIAPPANTMLVVLATPDDHAPGWIAETDPAGRIRLKPLHQVNVPEGKSLQFWTKGKQWQQPVSLGLVRSDQSVVLAPDQLPPVEPGQLFEITLEPYAGSPLKRPTGPVLHIGRAVRML